MASGPMYAMRSGGGRPPQNSAIVLDYGNGAFSTRPIESFGGRQYARESPNDGKFSRFGPYESYDSRSSLDGRDLYRSGYGYSEPEPRNFGDSFDDRFESAYRNSIDSYEGRNKGGSSWEASYPRPKLRSDFMDERGRDHYSSYGSFSLPYAKPASVGSWGRGMPAYPGNAYGGRSNAAFGGPSAGRGRDRGPRDGPAWGGPGAARGKRKIVQESPKTAGGMSAKKQKLSKSAVNQGSKKAPSAKVEGEEGRTEARREQQRRRREKYIEKYGDGYWMAFTCSFCKFRSFDEKGIETHLESDSHQEMLDHIQKQTKFDKAVMEFLHESIVNKYKKTSARKAQSLKLEASKPSEKDILDGVTLDDHMMKVETVHCGACSVYIPALHISVHLHLKSPEHAKSKAAYKEQIKRESILTATSILNNPVVKARYEVYLKGENPFDAQEAETKVEGEEEEEEEEDEESAQAAEPGETEDFTSDPVITTVA